MQPHFIPIPVIILWCWPGCLHLYFHCFRHSDCLASWVWGLVSTRSTRDTQQSLLASAWPPVPKQQLCRLYQPWPGSSDLCVSDVTSARSPSSLQCSEATEASSENNSSAGLSLPGPEHGGNTEKYAARELRLGQTLPPQHFVPNCYWFLQIRVILLVTESSSSSLRTSWNDFTSSSHHWSSNTELSSSKGEIEKMLFDQYHLFIQMH